MSGYPLERFVFWVLPEIRHTFTHLKAVYRPMLVVGTRSGGARTIRSDGPAPDEHEGDHDSEHQWVRPDQAEHLPLPVAQRKILGLARIALAAPALAAPALPASASKR